MSRRNPNEFSVYPEARARALAKVVGPSSAVAGALAEMERRRSEGEKVCLFVSGSFIVVGPAPLSPPQGGGHGG